MSDEYILLMEKATRRYKGDRGALDIDIALKPGAVLGLLGPNGSGKTTLLKLACGLSRPDSGRVLVSGFDVVSNPVGALAHLGALIESPALYDNMSVRANLRVAAKYVSGVTEAQIDRALEWVGMSKYSSERCKRLSLGMRQRVGLVLAFLGDIKLLLLDEPTNGLDIEGAVEVRNAIKRACLETGAAAIVSSHLSSELERVCDSAALMREGRIIAADTMPSILAECGTLEDYYLSRVGKGAQA